MDARARPAPPPTPLARLTCSTCRRRTTSDFLSTFIAYTCPVARSRTRKTFPKLPLPRTRRSSKSSTPTLPSRRRTSASVFVAEGEPDADVEAAPPPARAPPAALAAAPPAAVDAAPPAGAAAPPPAPPPPLANTDPSPSCPQTCWLMSMKALSSMGRGCRQSCARGRCRGGQRPGQEVYCQQHSPAPVSTPQRRGGAARLQVTRARGVCNRALRAGGARRPAAPVTVEKDENHRFWGNLNSRSSSKRCFRT